MAESPKNHLLRDFRRWSIFDFCNKIGTKRTKRGGLTISVVGGRPEVIGLRPNRRECHSGLAARRNSPNGIYEFRSFDRGLFIISRIKPIYKSASLKLIDER